MIKDCLGLSKRYVPTAPGLARAFAWLEETAENLPEDGRYEIDGERVFAIVASYSTVPRKEKILEGHYNYLDVQYLAEGGPEVIGFAAADRTPIVEDYDPMNDIVKYDPRAVESEIVLRKGDFAIFFPEDAHMPGVMYKEPARVRKIVVKIRV